MNNNARLAQDARKSDRRFKVGAGYGYDSESRAEQNELRRQAREYAAHLKRVQQEKEDRERYIIPEHVDLEEQLTG